MSKLDLISYETYTGDRPKFGDGTYKTVTDKTHNQLKEVFLELTEPEYTQAFNRGEDDAVYKTLVAIRQKVKEL